MEIDTPLQRSLLEETPLPPFWSKEYAVVDNGAEFVTYYNSITQERTTTHPAELYLQYRLAESRGNVKSGPMKGKPHQSGLEMPVISCSLGR